MTGESYIIFAGSEPSDLCFTSVGNASMILWWVVRVPDME